MKFKKLILALVFAVSAFGQEADIHAVPFTNLDRENIFKILDVVSHQGLAIGAVIGGAAPQPGAMCGNLPCQTSAPVPTPPPAPKVDCEDKYWSEQPAEVQELRKIVITSGKSSERLPAATALAARGFKIDPQIVVKGQGAQAQMRTRLSANYTWVPALGQPAILVAPGLDFPGLPSYNGANPPAGSIKVQLVAGCVDNSVNPPKEY